MAPSPSGTGVNWEATITGVGAVGSAGNSSYASSLPPSWVRRGQEGTQKGWLSPRPTPTPVTGPV